MKEPKKHKTTISHDDKPKTLEDMIDRHNATQDSWEERVVEWNAKLDIAVADIEEIKNVGQQSLDKATKDINKIKKQIKEFDVGHCVRDESFETLQDKYERTNEQLTQILINQATIITRLDKKAELDDKRNGKVDKIDDKEDAAEIRLARLEGKMEDHEKILSAIDALSERITRMEEKTGSLKEIFTNDATRKDTKQERRKDLILRIIVITISVIAIFSTVLFKWWGL